MKKIISILLIVSFILTVSACKPGVEGDSSSINSRSSDTQSMNSEITSTMESTPEKEAVPIMEAEEEDVLQLENSEESIEALNKIFHGGAGNMNSWEAMVDNTTDIAALAAAQPIDAETTWLLCDGLFNNGYNNYFRLKDFEMASRVKFVRELGEPYDGGWVLSNAQPGYTVFESEMGGYLYMFLGHLTDTDDIQVKSIIYVSHRMSIEDFASLNVGDSIDKVAQIDPVAYYTKRNLELSTVSRETYHLCTDGLLKIQYVMDNEDITIEEMTVYEDFILPNLAYSDDPDIQNSAERRYDFTILPQDYPPEA